MARRSGEENRRNVLEAATRLFYERGIRAVGMDTVLNTNTEFPEGRHSAHLVAVGHKQQVRDWFRSLAADAGAEDPERLADEL